MTEVERRGSVRVPARLAMEISVGGDVARVQSLNVSASGVYFASDIYIPVLTKLRVTLDLPDPDSGRSRSVACDGVVVRTEPDFEDKSVDEYQIACFFTDISERERASLEKYILGNVPF